MPDAEGYIQWIHKKLKLNNNFNKNSKAISNWKVNRGQIYSCHFGINIGYEKSRIEARPCVIVSSTKINHESGNVIVVPLSKNIKYDKKHKNKLAYPYHYILYKSNYPMLLYDSAVQCEDIRCVSKARLGKYIGNVTPQDLNEIKKRIKIALQM